MFYLSFKTKYSFRCKLLPCGKYHCRRPVKIMWRMAYFKSSSFTPLYPTFITSILLPPFSEIGQYNTRIRWIYSCFYICYPFKFVNKDVNILIIVMSTILFPISNKISRFLTCFVSLCLCFVLFLLLLFLFFSF